MATAVKIAAPRPAPFFTPVFIALDKGFWKDEGLDVSLSYGVDIDRLMQGDVDFLATGFAEVTFLRGADIRMVSGHSMLGGAHTLVLRGGMELADATEISVAGEEGERELRDLLGHYDVDLAATSINVRVIPDSHPAQWAELEKGTGDGGMLGAPWWAIAVRAGFRSYGSLSKFVEGKPFSSIITTGNKVSRDPDMVGSLVKGYVKAIEYCKADKESTLEAMMRFSSQWGVQDRDVAEMVYDDNAPYWTPEIDLPGVEKLMHIACDKLGKPYVPVDSYVDMRFIEAALATRT